MPDEAVEHVAKQVKVPASELGLYKWSGSTIEYHRSQIRKHLFNRRRHQGRGMAGQECHARRAARRASRRARLPG
ncbi:DUF4158 domain-containing protein [Streptosporangium sp. NPDC002607]